MKKQVKIMRGILYMNETSGSEWLVKDDGTVWFRLAGSSKWVPSARTHEGLDDEFELIGRRIVKV